MTSVPASPQELEIKVSAEKVIYKALQIAAKNIFDQFGICVKDVSINWIDISTHDKFEMIIESLELKTYAIVNNSIDPEKQKQANDIMKENGIK